MALKARNVALRGRLTAAGAILAAALALAAPAASAQEPDAPQSAAPAPAPAGGASVQKTATPQPNFDHAPLDEILKARVNEKGLVAYEALAADRAGLDAYIASIGAVAMPDLLGWPIEEQAAFYINAHNASARKHFIDHWPPKKGGFFGGSRLSINNVSGALTREKDLVAGELASLDQIENEIIRARYTDPRIPFALCNSALGGASLTPEAYSAANLGKQLDDASARFVRDPSKVFVDTSQNVTTISPVFKKRSEDFRAYVEAYPDVKANPSIPAKYQGAIAFITMHSDPRLQDWILRQLYDLKFGSYDWTLNSQ